MHRRPAFGNADLLAQHPPHNQQRFNQDRQIRQVLHKLPDARLEPDRPHSGNRHQGRSIMGSENEVELSLGRPCQSDTVQIDWTNGVMLPTNRMTADEKADISGSTS